MNRKQVLVGALAFTALSVFIKGVMAGTPTTTGNTAASGNGCVEFKSPLLRGMGKFSMLIWYYSITQNTNLVINEGGGSSLVPFSRFPAVNNIQILIGRAVNSAYLATNIMPTTGKWYCFGYTVDIGADPEVKAYIGDANTPMASFSLTQSQLGSGALNDNGGVVRLGTNSPGGTAPASFGFVTIATGIWSAARFEENRLYPKPSGDTLLMAWLVTESSPIARSLITGTTIQYIRMTEQAGVPPLAPSNWWNKKRPYVWMRRH